MTVNLSLKEQYSVNAHPPNFNFWTGCREIKRCEESKRTLKNPFASRLAKFYITLKLLRSYTSMIYCSPSVSIWAKSGFFGVKLLPLAGGPKDGKRFDAD